MAAPWIKMRCDLATDPAVIAIAAATGLDEDHVVGKLHRLWAWADGHLRDGNARSVTDSWVDRYLGVSNFARAMESAGWLTITEDGIGFPNFGRHMSATAKKRAQTAERVARCKTKGNAASVTSALPRGEKEEEKEKETPLSPPKGKGSPKTPEKIELPTELQSDRFQSTWNDWLAYRRDRRLTLTERTLRGQLRKLAEMGADRACEAIDQSITNGWAGIFSPKHGARGNGKPRYDDGPGQVHPGSRTVLG